MIRYFKIFLFALFAISISFQACSKPTFRLLTYNIRHGEGMDRQLNLERTAGVINRLNPDIVFLQEVDNGTNRTNKVDQAKELGQLTGMYSAFGKFMDYDSGEYGMAILSRLPIKETQNYVLPPGAEPRSALAARIEVDGKEIVFVGIHFYRTAEERHAQAQKVVDLFRDEPLPVVLGGDFNSTPDSEAINLLKQHWMIPAKGTDHLTFPSDSARTEIDYIMVRPKDRFEIISIQVVTEPLASDHRPVLLEVKLK